MKVSVSAYYAYARGASCRETTARKICRGKVRQCFFNHRRRYGSRRIAAELKMGRAAARSAMKREGLRAIAPKRFKPTTTDSKHNGRISPNLLQSGLNTPAGKGEVIVGDITYLPVKGGGFCYLACFQDKFTRRIIGWQVSSRMTAQLVADAFASALRRGHLKRGAIIHTGIEAANMRARNIADCYIPAAFGNQCREKVIVMIMLKLRVSFPDSRRS